MKLPNCLWFVILAHYEHQFVVALFSHGFLRFICGLVQASVFLEVLVSNQGAKGGKGDHLEIFSCPLSEMVCIVTGGNEFAVQQLHPNCAKTG